MSLDDPTPTEYFGPHAKRWTNPDTGVTLSLAPRDYYRAVAKEQLREEARRRDEAVSAAWNDAALYDRTTAETMNAEQLTADTMNVEPGWPKVISIDTVRERYLEPEAGLFKEEGVLLVPTGGWNPPEHQRYDLNGFRELAEEEGGQPLQASEGLPTTARRGGIKYPTAPPATSADGIKSAGTVRFLSLSEDDTFGLIRPVGASEHATAKAVSQWPAARHFKRRRFGRIAATLGLVYIIAVIGVLAVTGVVS